MFIAVAASSQPMAPMVHVHVSFTFIANPLQYADGATSLKYWGDVMCTLEMCEKMAVVPLHLRRCLE